MTYLQKDDTRVSTQQLIDINAFMNYFSLESKGQPVGTAINTRLTDPLYKDSDYKEFPTPTSMTTALQNDLEPFYDYETFDLDSLDQVKFRKAIVQEIN
jgi:hypothetical protein